MPKLNLKPTHAPIQNFYKTSQQYDHLDIIHEGAVRTSFLLLLDTCAKKVNATFVSEYQMRTSKGNRISIDGAILEVESGKPFAYWEAKDRDDDLSKAVKEKRDAGYPFDNIFFQNPHHGILYQDDQKVLEVDITKREQLVEALQTLFSYSSPVLNVPDDWYNIVAEFKEYVPTIAIKIQDLIAKQHERNKDFQKAFDAFYSTCQTSINPELTKDEVEKMLIQHIITLRIFRTVLERSDFSNQNIIATEIEKVRIALTRYSLSPEEFLKPLERFYTAIEQAAPLCKNYSQKQYLLNTLYEQFFQSFSPEKADTAGIVYTPQPIVDFMVNSIEHLLKSEFNQSISDRNVHIIDPFVGTGNFIVRLMQDINGTSLEDKYLNELHCNEFELLPYYISSVNIEREFWQRTTKYLSFKGIALADTFDMLEDRQGEIINRENTERVNKQKGMDMLVVIGNPPYNTGQKSENDNNKNRDYPVMNKRIKDTYAKDSKAKQKYKVYDPYVKAFKWASERIGHSGIVAFVTNHSFIGGRAFDGMRKHLAQDFNKVYLLNLGGNINKGQPAGSNVFNIKLGVSIAMLVKTEEPVDTPCIYYNNQTELQSKAETFDFLNQRENIGNVKWQKIQPNAKYRWLTKGLHDDFDEMIPMGTKEVKEQKGAAEVAKGVIFNDFSLGVSTNRDVWVYNFNQNSLSDNVQRMLVTYTSEVDRWKRQFAEWKSGNASEPKIDNFVISDERKIKWSSTLKNKLQAGKTTHFSGEKVRVSLYRPFTKLNLYFDPKMLIDRASCFPTIFPTHETETKNRVICVNSGSTKPFCTLMVNVISDLHLTGDSHCFPFYLYDKDGTNERENITNWALKEFRKRYNDNNIGKWDIFYYNYGVLHHSDYCKTYQEDLKDSYPHIPFAEDEEFWAFANAGRQLADLHVNYESVPEYTGLTLKETPNMPVDWKVEKMTWLNEKTQIRYNDFLTIEGIPVEAHDYKLGTRSALEWIVNQYKFEENKGTKKSPRSCIVKDPYRDEEPQYILNLIKRVITVSLETVKIVNNLPALHSTD